MRLKIVTGAALSALLLAGPASAEGTHKAELLTELPATLNSPASMGLDSAGNLYFTSPNFHNEAMVKAGALEAPAPPAIAKVAPDNTVSIWYTFTADDMEPTSGLIGPFGITFGPDGNAYFADMQLWFGGTSRIMRINVEDGKAMAVEPVVIGTSFPNALVFRGNDLFLSDTVLVTEKGVSTTSGLYKFSLDEMNSGPVEVKPYAEGDADPHLFETFTSNGALTFGANGLTVDGEGNLYTSIMEDGTIVKTTVDSDGNLVDSEVFARGMGAVDGMAWDAGTNKIYLTDLAHNAVYSVDMEGNKSLLAQNPDTDGTGGALDAPAEVIVRGKDAIITNFDATGLTPDMVNQAADLPITLSVIRLD
ncbi:hypothetical protein [Pacificoceanicola onchidii]|uniref:hypothetical protein n=1 Tax=Pacificoceanicola onchidii TaxID=2562685 RepID=UPI0010A6B111|nr:hypothetical protein [Pacificoceanicola onchidii]